MILIATTRIMPLHTGKSRTVGKAIQDIIDYVENPHKGKGVRQRLDKLKPTKWEQYQQEHETELASFDAAVRFLDELKASGEAITPKAWQTEVDRLTARKDLDYQKMRVMRDDLKAVERLKKAAEQLARDGQHQQTEHDR